ncbi:MAG: serine hydrolase [Bdellovibrionales bacterium]|nr:serine hydrolase [Bdellovibrionales bacterium]
MIIIWISFALLAFVGLWFVTLQILRIFVGYLSKYLASSVFISSRDPQKVIQQDLWYLPASWVVCTITDSQVRGRLRVFGVERICHWDRRKGVCLLSPMSKGTRFHAAQAIFVPKEGPYETLSLEPAKTKAFQDHGDQYFDTSMGHRTHALLCWKDGKLMYERYGRSFDEHTIFPGWSMSKSVTNAMLGIAVESFGFDLHKCLSEIFECDFAGLKPEHLLHMSSGIPWSENYFFYSDVTRMLYLEEDMESFLLHKGLKKTPGNYWKYSSGDTNLLQASMRKELGQLRYESLVYELLFDRIGMKSAFFETDATGLYVGSSYVHARARDWLRFGLMYLHEGNVCGEKVLDSSWVQYSQMAAPASKGEYGGHFWKNESMKMPDVSRDCYSAEGFMGQRVFILPSDGTVIVRLGSSKKDAVNFNEMIQGFLSYD